MDRQTIEALIDALGKSGLAELEYTQDGATLRLVRLRKDAAPAAAPLSAEPAPAAPAPVAAAPSGQDVLAPLYGVVHLRPSPGAPPFVTPGQRVTAGQPLCLMEAMKVFNELRAERDGVVEAVLVESGQEVEAGQMLFRLG